MAETASLYKNYYIIAPDIDGADADDVIRISKKAMEQIEHLVELRDVPESFYLRLGLRGGGIEGTKFFMEFDSTPTEYDKIYNVSNVQALIDTRSIFYLLGFSIEYSVENENSEGGFILTQNELQVK